MELLGVWRGVHCGLLIFKLALLCPQGTPDCLHCSVKSGPRKREIKRGDQIDIKGEGMIGKIKNRRKQSLTDSFFWFNQIYTEVCFVECTKYVTWWTGAQRKHGKGVFPHCERIFLMSANKEDEKSVCVCGKWAVRYWNNKQLDKLLDNKLIEIKYTSS